MRVTGPGILVNDVVASNDTKNLSGATRCSMRHSTNPYLSFMKGKLLLQY